MFDIQRKPDVLQVLGTDGKPVAASVRFDYLPDRTDAYLSAPDSEPAFVVMRWKDPVTCPLRICRDAWERGYGNLAWGALDGETYSPWYFLAAGSGVTYGAGVMVRPNAFVSFQTDASGVTGWFDVRNGASGVRLGDRELKMASLVSRSYTGITSFQAACAFCKVMCTDPLLPEKPVYGGNNWYYAYGNSSAEEILNDTRLIAQLSEGLENRPYMVIDDGWQKNSCAGPWFPNDKFGDMKQLAAEMAAMDVLPGIWVRPLFDAEYLSEHKELAGNGNCFDPSHPGTLAYVREMVERIAGWGYKLLKHDYSTFDIFGNWGLEANGSVTNRMDWHFFDRTKTSAEIVLQLYRTIKEAAGDMVIIGCNTVSHLTAGLSHLNRVGDDTSGEDWDKTRIMGVNSLAFRLPHNNAFYAADADCMGVIKGTIDPKLNLRWAKLLAYSGTPMFISCPINGLNEEETETMKKLFAVASKQTQKAEPLDWEYNREPQHWLIDGEPLDLDLIDDHIPPLRFGYYPHCQTLGR